MNIPPIGTTSDPKVHTIEAGAIRNFAEALGLQFPAYFSKVQAQDLGFQDVIAPPTFAITLQGHAVPGLDLPKAGLIHGEQSFKFGDPITVHDEISVVTQVIETKARGPLTFLTLETVGTNQHLRWVFTSTSTIIANQEAL